MNPMLVMMAASTAFSIYGSWKAQQDKEEAARRQHALAMVQNTEIRRRLDANIADVSKQERLVSGAIVSQAAASGIGMSTTIMDRLTDVVVSAENEKRRMNEEAFYQMDLISMGADINLDMVRKGSTANVYGTLASLSELGFKSYDYWDSKNKETPSPTLTTNT
jgi:hypothetical protein